MKTSYYGDISKKKTEVNKGLYGATAQKLPATTQSASVQKLPGTTQNATAQSLVNNARQKATVQDFAIPAKAPATYDANTDYAALIDKAIAAGDWQAAKGYEEQRNAKIADMNAANANPNGYTSGYYAQAVQDKYADTDYAAQINEAIRTGDVYGGMKLDAQRNEKIDAYNSAGLNQEGYEKDYYKNWLTNYVNSQNDGDKVGLIDENGNRVTGVTSSALGYYDDLIGKLDGLYQEEKKRGESYYADAIAQAEQELKTQRDAINLDYDNLAKQHYIDREMAEKNLPQMLAAMGYTGGLTESSLLGIGYDYESNLNAAERARSRQLMEQQNYYAQALRAAAREKADMDSAAKWQHFNYYAQAIADKVAQQRYEDEWAYQKEQDALNNQRYDAEWAYQQQQDALANERYDQEWAYQKEQDALNNQRYDAEWAYQQQLDQQGVVKNMVAMGIVPSAEMLAAAYGLTPEQAEAYRQQLQAANTPAVSGTYYYTEPEPQEETPNFSITGASTTPTPAGEGYRPSEWSYIVNNVRTNLRENNAAAVKSYMEMLRDDGLISTAQWNELAAMLAAEGWTSVPTY